jgi:hypothetical protein
LLVRIHCHPLPPPFVILGFIRIGNAPRAILVLRRSVLQSGGGVRSAREDGLSAEPDEGSCTRKDPDRYERAALRWLNRYLTEGKAVTLLRAHLALAARAELRAGEREHAARLLVELATRA